jgi:plastocyanin
MQLKYQGLVFMCAAFLGACGSSTTSVSTPPAPAAMAAEVEATPSITFSPNSVTILRGGAVTFDFGSVVHNVYFDGGPAGAPANITGQNANVSKSLTFNTVGTFVYNCHIHPGMHGTVVVVE